MKHKSITIYKDGEPRETLDLDEQDWLDTVKRKAPYLQIDGESFKAFKGNIRINGMVENGASLKSKGEEVPVTVWMCNGTVQRHR